MRSRAIVRLTLKIKNHVKNTEIDHIGAYPRVPKRSGVSKLCQSCVKSVLARQSLHLKNLTKNSEKWCCFVYFVLYSEKQLNQQSSATTVFDLFDLSSINAVRSRNRLSDQHVRSPSRNFERQPSCTMTTLFSCVTTSIRPNFLIFKVRRTIARLLTCF